jgi:hypothetical protein
VDGVWDDQEDEVLQHALWSAGEAPHWEADTLLAAFEDMTALAIHSYGPAQMPEYHYRMVRAFLRCALLHYSTASGSCT